MLPHHPLSGRIRGSCWWGVSSWKSWKGGWRKGKRGGTHVWPASQSQTMHFVLYAKIHSISGLGVCVCVALRFNLVHISKKILGEILRGLLGITVWVQMTTAHFFWLSFWASILSYQKASFPTTCLHGSILPAFPLKLFVWKSFESRWPFYCWLWARPHFVLFSFELKQSLLMWL